MSVGYVDLKKVEDAILRLFTEKQRTEDIDKVFTERKNSLPFAMAARLVRAHHKKIEDFLNLFVDSTDGKYDIDTFKGHPMIVLGSTPDTLRVYPNIILDSLDKTHLSHCSWALFWNVLDTTYKGIQEDLAHKQRSQRWSTPSRIWGALKRHEEMPISRALARFSRLKGVPADKLAAIASAIEEARKPLELKWADTVEGIIEMYGSGPSSCMSHNSHGWGIMVTQAKTHPCSFFVYHPHVRGVYSLRKGQVSARTYVYEQKNGKKVHGRVYSANQKIADAFTRTLKSQGVESMGRELFKRDCEFDIPVENVPSCGGAIIPFPYLDNLGGAIYAKLNEDGKTIHIRMTEEAENRGNIRQTSAGYLPLHYLENKRCACGAYTAQDGARLTSSLDGLYLFHNLDCANAVAYVHAMRSDGERVYIPRSEAYIDPHQHGYFYTNIEVARSRGAMPFVETFMSVTEDSEGGNITHSGVPFMFPDGNIYRVLQHDYAHERSSIVDRLVDGCQVFSLPPDIETQIRARMAGSLTINVDRRSLVTVQENERLFVEAA